MHAKISQAVESRYTLSEKTSETDDQRIKDVTPLPPPEHLIRFFPIAGTPVEKLIGKTRQAVRQIMQRKDDRLLVVIGPCSIHDPAAALMVDCSHANSNKQFERQLDVARDVASQIEAGSRRIFGVMIESHINPGRQDLVPGQPLQYGVSITDACIGWDTTVEILHELAAAARARRVRLSDAT